MSAELAAFGPSAARAAALDARMRERLRTSLDHVLERAGGALEADPAAFEAFAKRLEAGRVHHQVFAAYCDLIPAVEAGNWREARTLWDEIVAWPPPDPGLAIRDLADPARDRAAARCARILASDPSAPFEIRTPSAAASRAGRDRIAAARELLREADPALAAEIDALVHEIVLAVGPPDDDAAELGGAASFALWGGVLVNPTACTTRVDTVRVLAHETAHNLLFGLSADDPLVEPDDGRHASPLRDDPRPVEGIYHASFVIARMHRAARVLLASGHLLPEERAEAEAAASADLGRFARGLEVVERHARTTPLGAEVLAGARAHMSGAGAHTAGGA